MRSCRAFTLVLLAATSSAALAADHLSYGPVPQWVKPQAVPTTSNAPPEAPVAILLNDQQIKFEPGKTTTYTETAIKIQNGEGLAAGNISVPWDPTTDTVTVHKLLIWRGADTIDVLKNGQTFTTLRREQNLDAAMLDGRLTANIQPEGLQQGDVLILATSFEQRDPVLKGHVEGLFGNWNGVPFKAARVRLLWPDRMKLRVQRANLPASDAVRRGGQSTLEISLDDAQPLITPKGAPLRFQVGRYGEASDFASWGEVAELMVPHYRAASIIPVSGSLRDEVEKIRKSGDHRTQVEQALALVQDRVRYVALLMGEGGYVPASAEATWSRRFGDCKAKTVLLLGILHELGVKADPVLVNTVAGDVLSDRLPMLGVFNHVLVRAEIGGKTYWLDGTRTGDASLDSIPVPNYQWGLPIVAAAQLVRIAPSALTIPDFDVAVTIDATKGIYAPADFRADHVLRGDPARMAQATFARLSPAQAEETKRGYWKNSYPYVTIKSASFTFDKETADLHMTMTGEAKLGWEDGWFTVPNASLAYDPNFERTAGINREAPFALAFPNYEHAHVEIRLPPSYPSAKATSPSVRETLAGVEYARTVTMKDRTIVLDRSERTVVPEIAYRDALAADARLKALNDEDVYLRTPAGYQMTAADRTARLADKPASAKAFIDRGLLFLNDKKYDEAILDFNEALKLEPENEWAWANRGITHAWKNEAKEAEVDFAKAAAINPSNPVVSRGRALVAELRGDFKAAVDGFSTAIKQDPDNPFSYMHRASAYGQLGETDKAIADTDELLKRGNKSTDIRLVRANIFLRSSRREEALREADVLSAESQSETLPLVTAASIYSALGKHDRARKALDSALAIKAEAYIYVNRARTRPRTDFTGKLADLEAALKLDPKDIDALLSKAEVLTEQRRYADALSTYDETLRTLAPDESVNAVSINGQRAILLSRLGRNIESRKLFAEARSAAKSPMQLNNLCWAKATANVELESALEDCQEAVRQEPKSGAILDSLGLTLLRLGRLDDAVAAYDKAIIQRTGASSLMGRAIVRALKGDMAGAAADRAAALNQSAGIEDEYRSYGLEMTSRADEHAAARP